MGICLLKKFAAFLLIGFGVVGSITTTQTAEAAPSNYCNQSILYVKQVAKDQCQILKSTVLDPTACIEEVKACETEIGDRLQSTLKYYSEALAIFYDYGNGSFRVEDHAECVKKVHELFIEQHLYIPDGSTQEQSFDADFQNIKAEIDSACHPEPQQNPEPAKPADPSSDKASSSGEDTTGNNAEPATQNHYLFGCSLNATPLANNGLWMLLLGLPLLRTVLRRK